MHQGLLKTLKRSVRHLGASLNQTTRPHVHHRRLLCEPLEDRRLLGGYDITQLGGDASTYFFSQRDFQWKDDRIIDQNGTDCGSIESIGCAMTCTAMLVDHYGKDTDPGQLNAWLSNNDGYATGGFLYWTKSADYSMGKMQYESSLSWTPDNWEVDNDHWTELKAQLDQGYPVIVKVDAYPSTPALDSHWVLVTAFKGGSTTNPANYSINDPWDLQFDASATLAGYYDATYDNTFFATRVYHGESQPPSMINGIDVSHYQGSIDWSQVVSSGQVFAFANATDGDDQLYDDAFFVANMSGGNASGVLMGAYHFAYPDLNPALTGPESAESEALHFVDVVGPYLAEGYLRPVLDIERGGAELGKQALSTWVLKWMETVQNRTGIEPILYVNSNYARNYLSTSLTQYDLWIAHWTYDPSGQPDTGIWSTWDFWQYSDTITIPGIIGSVDGDVFNGDLSRLTSEFVIGQDTTPAAPTGVAASDGTYTDKVRITWNASTGATGYEVWRHTSNNSSAATRIGSNVTGTSYNDTGATAGTTYYYWVKAKNSGGTSGFSSPDTGRRAVAVPAAPTGVAASDGTYTNKVRITWNASTGATGYEVWRHTSNNSSAATRIGSNVTGTSYNDTGATAGTTYYYWVKAKNSGGTSGFSSPDTGWRSVAAPAAPTGVAASDGTYTDKVRITWNASTGATGYEVWRHTSNNSSAATRIASDEQGTSYNDTGATAGTTYYYWLKAKNSGGTSGFSSPDTGWRAVVVPAGITVDPTSGLTTTESGGTDQFTVVLDSKPTADVTIEISSSDTTEGTVSPDNLIFTPGNWNQAQSVTVIGVDDWVDDGNIAYTVLTAQATSADPNYNGLNPDDVGVVNNDNDTPGITVTPIMGLTTTEAGGTDQFTVVLDSKPTADVTIGISSNDTTEGTVSPDNLIFTPGNWNQPQTVTVTGMDDTLDDGDITYTIVTASATSSDPKYAGMDADDVSVTNVDDEVGRPFQIVSGTSDSVLVIPGGNFSVGVEYTTSDNDNTLTGLGLRMHYNSSVMDFNNLSNLLPTGFEQQQPPMDDTVDFDKDLSTDKYVLIVWADPTGNWPNQSLPVDLFGANFSVLVGVAEGTTSSIRFSSVSTPPSHDFQGNPITVTVVPTPPIPPTSPLDPDGNGVFEGKTDGKLIIRYLFGFRGASLTEGIVLPPDATRKDPVDIANFLSSTGNALDVDDNGGLKALDALTDGILILRYADKDNYPGDDFTDNAVRPGAKRTDRTKIIAYLDSLLPQVAASQSTEFAPSPTSENGVEEAGENRQIITSDPQIQIIKPGEPVSIKVNYTTNPEDSTLTGLGLRMHYNSSVLTFDSFDNQLQTGFEQEQSTPMYETGEIHDDDPNTDKYVLIAWDDKSGNWPGQISARLFTAEFTSSADAKAATSVNFTASSTTTGWNLDATPAAIDFLGKLSGFVYADTNNDGTFDKWERGIPGVKVTATGVAKPSWTDKNGRYEFAGLAAGTYEIVETQPKGFRDGKDTAGKINGMSNGTANNPGNSIDNIALGVDEAGTDYNFGERGMESGLLSLRLFLASTPPQEQYVPYLMARVHKAAGNDDVADKILEDAGLIGEDAEPKLVKLSRLWSDEVIKKAAGVLPAWGGFTSGEDDKDAVDLLLETGAWLE